ncbi:MAG: LLM class F420-dependent oxidoreductase [Chloroflexi bacterium]|nr:LLM class F420-dependent oxidoreductase [Chloroflexota bacterium]MBI3170070.1 LLM class F420-dependent oxidoreductase [Chloroflexota bacterium]
MLEAAIMIEGQNGLNWSRWQKIVRLVEELGFVGLYRSDHFTNMNPPDKDSLELWVSLTWLASNTKRIEFGPLVTPVSFRHPALTARMASAVDDLSNGRLTLGLGAGWQEREHHVFAFNLLDKKPRFDRFEEGLQVITLLLNSETPVSFDGAYYQLREATLLPRPLRPGGPRILIGGNGPNRTPSLVARFSHEWNAMFLTVEQFKEANRRIDDALEKSNRDLKSVRRSMMTGCVFGHNDLSLKEKLEARGRSKEELHQRGIIAGSTSEVKEQLQMLAEAGLQRIMLQWLDLDDLSGLEALAKAVH